MEKMLKRILIGISILVFVGSVYAYSSGITEHSQDGCTPCHAATSPQTTVTITGIPDQYVQGNTYLLTINVTSTSVSGDYGGFDLSVTDGILSTTDPNSKIEDDEATHQNNNARSWQVNWTAPTGVVSVDFYVAGLASDGTGGEEYAINTYSVTAEEPPTGNLLPIADFIYTRHGMTIEFEDQSSDEDGNVTSWHWNFGDGSSSNLTNPTHTFAKPGRYKVTLTVKDDQDDSNTQSQTFLVPSKEEILQLWTLQISIGSAMIVFTTLFAIGIATSRKRAGQERAGKLNKKKEGA